MRRGRTRNEQPDLISRLSEMERRLRALERAPRIGNTAFNAGQLSMTTGSTVVTDTSGTELFRTGNDGIGTHNFDSVWTTRMSRTDGTTALQVYGTEVDPGAITIHDKAENIITSENYLTGEGLGRPYLLHSFVRSSDISTPPVTTTSGTFTGLWRVIGEVQHSSLRVMILVSCPSGTTATVRVTDTVSLSIISNEEVVASGTSRYVVLEGEFLESFGEVFNYSVEVERTSGAGTVSTQMVYAMGCMREIPVPPEVTTSGGYTLNDYDDITADISGMNLTAHTVYRSIADESMFPGYNMGWLQALGLSGVWQNWVLEFRHWGMANYNPQTFSALGTIWNVPAPNMYIRIGSPSTTARAYGYNQITSGQCDGLLARALEQYRDLGYPVNIQWGDELDVDHADGITEGGVGYTWSQADSRAVDAIHYCIDWLEAQGTPAGTTYSIGVRGNNNASFIRLHPETLMEKLDYMQWNVLNTGTTDTAYNRMNTVKQWVINDLGPIANAKPVMIADIKTNAALGNQATWISSLPSDIITINGEAGPEIVYVNYHNSGTGALSPSAAGLAALRDAYNVPPFAA